MRITKWKIIILSLIPLGTEMLWGLYNSYVPIYLQSGSAGINSTSGFLGFGLTPFFAGIILSFSNVFSIFVNPYFGSLSDNTLSRIGRRKPYILTFVPLLALSFVLIPIIPSFIIKESNGIISKMPGLFIMFVAACTIICLIWSALGNIVVAMRWDVIDTGLRSKAQGFVVFITYIGMIFIMLVGPLLYKISPVLPFSLVSGELVLALLLVMLFHKEPYEYKIKGNETKKLIIFNQSISDSGINKEGNRIGGIINSFLTIKSLPIKNRTALIRVVLAIVFNAAALSILKVFLTSYIVFSLHEQPGFATQLSGIFYLMVLITAIPTGIISTKIGKQKSVIVGFLMMASVLWIAFVFTNTYIFIGILIFVGLFMNLVNINLVLLSVDCAENDLLVASFLSIGSIASTFGSFIGPILSGFIIQIFSKEYRIIFLLITIFYLLGAASLTMINKKKPKISLAE